MRAARAAERRVNMALELTKAAVLSVAVSFVLVVLYAMALKEELLDTSTMAIATTAIKAVCAALAGLICVARCKRRLWLYGAIGGAAYMAASFGVFSLVAGSFSPSLALLSDLGLGALAGLLSVMLRQALK